MSAAVEIIKAPMGGAWACPLDDPGTAALQSFFGEEPVELRPLCDRIGYIVEPYQCADLAEHLRGAGSHCKGTWCPRAVRKEHIRKDEFDAGNPDHFRLQSRGGAWRYYRKVG